MRFVSRYYGFTDFGVPTDAATAAAAAAGVLLEFPGDDHYRRVRLTFLLAFSERGGFVFLLREIFYVLQLFFEVFLLRLGRVQEREDSDTQQNTRREEAKTKLTEKMPKVQYYACIVLREAGGGAGQGGVSKLGLYQTIAANYNLALEWSSAAFLTNPGQSFSPASR